MATSSYKVLLAADSRALDIDKYLGDWGDITLDIVPAPSTGIEAAVELLVSQKKGASPDLILILNGICDILVKNRLTRKYFLIKETDKDLVEHYMAQVDKGQELLQMFFRNAKWMFNPLTGADIYDYNNPIRKQLKGEELAAYHAKKPLDHRQEIINQAVLDINTRVCKVNKNNKVITPYTATYGSGYHHSYHYTSDGCHLTEDGKKYWAKQIKKAIDKTRMLDS